MLTVICLHCSGSSPRQWTGLAAALSPEHRTIAPDLAALARRPAAAAEFGA